MSNEALRKYLKTARVRYKNAASRREKTQIVSEFHLNFRYSRKYAIRILNGLEPSRERPAGRKKIYGPELIAHLKRIWLAMGQPCSKRLKRALPGWLPHYRKRYEASDDILGKLLQMSPATIDRLLKPIKTKHGLSSTRTSGQWYKSVIPVRPKDWNITDPGHLQGDTVAHCGDSLSGMFANTLTLTDIFSSWTENRATWGKGGRAILESFRDIEKTIPFKIETAKFDSGSEFMNHIFISHLSYRYKRRNPIAIYRSRPYKKDDNCYVEEKNFTHVRSLFGYDRIDVLQCVEQMNKIYRDYWNPIQNFFMPAMKLLRKERVGARIKKTYDTPKTPYERLKESQKLTEEQKATLTARYEKLDPFELQESLQKDLKNLFETLKKNRGPLKFIA